MSGKAATGLEQADATTLTDVAARFNAVARPDGDVLKLAVNNTAEANLKAANIIDTDIGPKLGDILETLRRPVEKVQVENAAASDQLSLDANLRSAAC